MTTPPQHTGGGRGTDREQQPAASPLAVPVSLSATARPKYRGDGGKHKRLRAMWQRRIDAGEVVICARAGCNLPILPGMLWDLGHSDSDGSRYAGPEHRRCNRRAGGRVGAKVVHARRRRKFRSRW